LPELGRIHNINEKGRNHLALALWNSLRLDGGTQSEGEVRGLRLIGRVASSRPGGSSLGKRRTTFIAVLRSGSIECAAGGTMQR
jgi:hypothetical protein